MADILTESWTNFDYKYGLCSISVSGLYGKAAEDCRTPRRWRELVIVRAVKVCNVEEKLGPFSMKRKVKKGVTKLKRRSVVPGAADETVSADSKPKVGRRKQLLLIECREAAVREITPKRAAKILLDQDVKWMEESGRGQRSRLT